MPKRLEDKSSHWAGICKGIDSMGFLVVVDEKGKEYTLSGEEVSIVTPIAGTTRDSIKNNIQINGLPLNIIDTAGLRETNDEVEKIGIARTYRALENAQVAILLIDAAHGIGDDEKVVLTRLPQEITKIWVHNKIDTMAEPAKFTENAGEAHIYLSAKTGEGIELLKQHLLNIAGYQQNAEGVFMARARHLEALKHVDRYIGLAQKNVHQPEIIAEELRLAQEALSTITGEFTPDDLLGEIFSKFCIGK
jgi:tRNA modification GTPase